MFDLSLSYMKKDIFRKITMDLRPFDSLDIEFLKSCSICNFKEM